MGLARDHDIFQTWLDEVADIPLKSKKDGTWFDAETGFTFAQYAASCDEAEKPKRQTLSKRGLEHRKAAKSFGAKALRGTKKQKEWGEKIRLDILNSSLLTDEEKTELVNCGGFTSHAAFWIANRDVKHSDFKARDIVAQYRPLAALEAEHYDFLVRTNCNGEKEKRRQIIRDYMSSCTFNFKSNLI